VRQRSRLGRLADAHPEIELTNANNYRWAAIEIRLRPVASTNTGLALIAT
jgi:hypothetical protein